MYQMKRTYEDFNGVERTETFCFNLTKAEITQMQFSKDGGFNEFLTRIVDARDGKTIIKTFQDIVLMAYGEKSEDGRHFMKSDAIRDAFKSTQAYSDIYMELATDDEKAAEFINKVLPKDLAVQVEAHMNDVAKANLELVKTE